MCVMLLWPCTLRALPYMAGSAQMCVIGSMLESGLAWPGLWPRLDVDTVQLESCGLYESRSLWRNAGGSGQDLLS